MTDRENVEGWAAVFTASTDYEADMVRDRLDDAGIPAVVFTQRDHAFNLNVGELSRTAVYVPPDRAREAEALLAAVPISGAELDQAALDADPVAPDAHTPDDEALLDSGIEKITLTVPDDDYDEEDEDEDEVEREGDYDDEETLPPIA